MGFKTNFLDDIVQYPNRYVVTDNGDGTKTITPSPGIVTQAGTAITSTRMNAIQNEVVFYIEDTRTVENEYIAELEGLDNYYKGLKIACKFNSTNAGPCTININSLGAKAIKKDVSTDLESGNIKANQIGVMIYDGTNFQLVSGKSISASNLSYDNSISGLDAINVQDAIDELFTNVSDGKNLIATAITDVDDSLNPSGSDTFSQLAGSIRNISTGKKHFRTTMSKKQLINYVYVGDYTNLSGYKYENYNIRFSFPGIDFIPNFLIIEGMKNNTDHNIIVLKKSYPYTGSSSYYIDAILPTLDFCLTTTVEDTDKSINGRSSFGEVYWGNNFVEIRGKGVDSYLGLISVYQPSGKTRTPTPYVGDTIVTIDAYE
ncbi:hypothetical protein [Dethiothermospora halolimnae]|uniref:hypothetical protein n=1 Tax=Dethiothermospora halolimnae TaxID=3114390 RepID=UPI003CCBFC61